MKRYEPQHQKGQSSNAASGKQRYAENQPGISPCPQKQPSPHGAADSSHASAGNHGCDKHEKGENLRDTAKHREDSTINLTAYPQVGHGNRQMAQHEAHLRNSELQDFPRCDGQ